MYKKIFTIIITFAMIVINGVPLKAYALSSENNDNFGKIDGYVLSQMKNIGIPGAAVGIVKGRDTVYMKGYGKADNTGREITPQTPFIIGSVSKSFTAMAVMQLVEQKKINLDSPIQQYLPWFKQTGEFSSQNVTVRQLLNQNSGIQTYYSAAVAANTSIEDLTRGYLNNRKMAGKPGEKFIYSNANYIILGEIVQVVSGESFQEYIKKNIFDPLDMKHSFLSWDEAVKNGAAKGYGLWFGIPSPADSRYFVGGLPEGYIISCAEDMTHYLVSLMNDGKYGDVSVLSPDSIKELYKPAVKTMVNIGTDATESYYAMGWEVGYKDGAASMIEHTGETAGFHAHIVIKPSEKLGVIELDNIGGSVTAGNIAYGVIDTYGGNAVKESGLSVKGFVIVQNLILLVLLVLIVISAIRLKTFEKRLNRSKASLIINTASATILNFIIPAAIYIGMPKLWGDCPWRCSILIAPDVSYSLLAISISLFIIGVIKAAKIFCMIDKNKSIEV